MQLPLLLPLLPLAQMDLLPLLPLGSLLVQARLHVSERVSSVRWWWWCGCGAVVVAVVWELGGGGGVGFGVGAPFAHMQHCGGEKFGDDDKGITWRYGFSWEHKKAWKCKADEKTSVKDWTDKIAVEVGKKGDPFSENDPVTAVFEDGITLTVPFLMQKQWCELNQTATDGSNTFYKTKRGHDTQYTTVKYRKDRGDREFYGVFVGQSLKCLCRIAHFGGHAKLVALQLGKEFVANLEMTKGDLDRRRDDLLKELQANPCKDMPVVDESTTRAKKKPSRSIRRAAPVAISAGPSDGPREEGVWGPYFWHCHHHHHHHC